MNSKYNAFHTSNYSKMKLCIILIIINISTFNMEHIHIDLEKKHNMSSFNSSTFELHRNRSYIAFCTNQVQLIFQVSVAAFCSLKS